MWSYKNKPFTSECIIPEIMYAFIYTISNDQTGKKYIGKKVLFSKRRLPPLKGKVRPRIVIKESDWAKYWSSCKPLLNDISTSGHDNFTRTILEIFPNKTEANYAEMKYQIINNVLDSVDENGQRLWYNENIARIYYPSTRHHESRNELHTKMISNFNKLEKI